MKKMKEGLDKVVEWICIVGLAILTILVTYQVVVRYIFNNPNAYTEAVCKYMFIWLIMVSAAYVFGLREHMNIEFIQGKMPPKVKIIVEMFSEFVIALFAVGLMIYGGFSQSLASAGQLDASLQISIAFMYSAVPAGGVLIIFYCIYNEWMLAGKLRELK